MPLYEYKCRKCGSVIEKLVSMDQRNSPHLCEVEGCSGESHLILSLPQIKLEGVTGDFPGAALKWDNRHKSNRG